MNIMGFEKSSLTIAKQRWGRYGKTQLRILRFQGQIRQESGLAFRPIVAVACQLVSGLEKIYDVHAG